MTTLCWPKTTERSRRASHAEVASRADGPTAKPRFPEALLNQDTEGSSLAKIDVTADLGVTTTSHQNGRPRHPLSSSPFWPSNINAGMSLTFGARMSACCLVSG